MIFFSRHTLPKNRELHRKSIRLEQVARDRYGFYYKIYENCSASRYIIKTQFYMVYAGNHDLHRRLEEIRESKIDFERGSTKILSFIICFNPLYHLFLNLVEKVINIFLFFYKKYIHRNLKT